MTAMVQNNKVGFDCEQLDSSVYQLELNKINQIFVPSNKKINSCLVTCF